MKKHKITLNKYFPIYAAVAVFYFWMAAQIPYTHDDWDWGLDIGIHQLLYGTINSRYVGNFFVVIMTRSELLKNVLMGICFFLIPFILTQFAAKEAKTDCPKTKVTLFLVSNCILLTMNRFMWKTTYGWVSGFANFCVSALFLMIWIKEILKAFGAASVIEKEAPCRLCSFFILSVCCQLFIENIAIYCVLLAIILCILYYYRYRKIPVRLIIMLIGSIIGLIVMFSSSLYDTLLSTGTAINNYRRIPMLTGLSFSGVVLECIYQIIHLCARLYSANYVLSMAVLTVFTYLLIRKPRTSKRLIQPAFCITNIVLMVCFTVCFIYDNSTAIHTSAMYKFDFLVSFSYFLCITAQLPYLFQGDSALGILLALWFSPPVVIAPLIITMEIGYRLFYTSNLFILIFLLILLGRILHTCSFNTIKKIMSATIAASILLICYHGIIYAQIGSCKRARDTIINNATSNNITEITLPAYPHQKYLHNPNPSEELRLDYFRAFYDIPNNITIFFEE